MIRIIFTDDNVVRVEKFIKNIEKKEYFHLLDIQICYSADEARRKLIIDTDILILDVLLPKKRGATPVAEVSKTLLQEIFSQSSRYMRPKLIIGLTSDEEKIIDHQNVFYSYASLILNGKKGEAQWMNNIIFQIESFLDTEKKRLAHTKKRLLITIHGIRTYGTWQNVISEKINDYSTEYIHEHFNYGFFDLITFCIPYLRKRKEIEISKRVISCLNRNNTYDISLIAHSFGTLIAKRAIENCTNNVDTIIFCGSPLKNDTNISTLINKSKTFINECGIHDIILILSKIFVLGLGDGGRKGFIHETNNKFLNRYHIGNHSLYFSDENEHAFIRDNWIPLLTTDMRPKNIDMRKNYLMEDIIEFLLSFLGYIKPYTYIIITLLLILPF
ncbi:alpha/beta hydrolase [Enterobacter soli]